MTYKKPTKLERKVKLVKHTLRTVNPVPWLLYVALMVVLVIAFFLQGE